MVPTLGGDLTTAPLHPPSQPRPTAVIVARAVRVPLPGTGQWEIAFYFMLLAPSSFSDDCIFQHGVVCLLIISF